MRITRTANLAILKTWLLGGYTSNQLQYGSIAEGFHCLRKSQSDNYPKSLEETKSEIESLIIAYGNEPSGEGELFIYYDKPYEFRLPTEKNLNILAKRVWSVIKKENLTEEE